MGKVLHGSATGAVQSNAPPLDGLDYVLSSKFQERAVEELARWDKEWLRYFSIHKDYGFYFYNMNTSSYALNIGPSAIEKLSADEMFSVRLFKKFPAHVWAPGTDLVGKTVLEMGCGPGFFGRMASRFVTQFIGLDASKLALHIAEVASPANCHYLHLTDVAEIAKLSKSVDTCFGRNFFIHHNYDDSLWILKFLRDLTKPGGLISADFYYKLDRVGEDRRHTARDSLNADHASALYTFTERDIRDIAADAGIEIVQIGLRPKAERHFATFRVG